MKPPRRRFLELIAGAATLPAVSTIAWAQTYPTRPITMIVPFPAGGPTDVIGRLVAERMRAALGQPVLIENITGANGSIGVGRAVRAAPDGYTLSIGQLATHVANGAAYSLQYDLLKDLQPISLLTTQAFLIVGKKTIPANDLKGLIAWLKENPNASLGTPGVGSIGHISGVYFQKVTGTGFQFVPYRGAAPAMQDLVAGQIDMMFADLISALPQVHGGSIKAYAVMAETRLAAAPDIPTTDEAGMPGLHVSFWHGLWAPKGTPKDTITKLNAAIVAALAESSVRERLADLGQDIFPRDHQTPEALEALQKAEIEKWWPIIKATGIKGE